MEVLLKVSWGSWKVGMKNKSQPQLPKILLTYLSPYIPMFLSSLSLPPFYCASSLPLSFPHEKVVCSTFNLCLQLFWRQTWEDVGKYNKWGSGSWLSQQTSSFLRQSFLNVNALCKHLGISSKCRCWFSRSGRAWDSVGLLSSLLMLLVHRPHLE